MGLFERILQPAGREPREVAAAGGHHGGHGHGGGCCGGGHGQHTDDAERGDEVARPSTEASSDPHAGHQHAGHAA